MSQLLKTIAITKNELKFVAICESLLKENLCPLNKIIECFYKYTIISPILSNLATNFLRQVHFFSKRTFTVKKSSS